MSQTVADDLIDALEPWITDDLKLYARAVASMFEAVAALVRDTGIDGDAAYMPGWGILFDIDACPTSYLAYLGQFVGVQLTGTGLPDSTMRVLIRQERGHRRGTLAAIVSAATRNLDPDRQRCWPIERFDTYGENAYWLLLVVEPGAVIDADQLHADIDAVKPGGVFYTVIESAAPLLAQWTRQFSAITATLPDATLADVT